MTARLCIAPFAIVAAVLLLAASCGGDGERTVTGVVLQVESSSIEAIESFTLRSNEGDVLEFAVAPDAVNDPREGFFPSHLRSHALAAERVTVHYRDEDGRLLATRLTHE